MLKKIGFLTDKISLKNFLFLGVVLVFQVNAPSQSSNFTLLKSCAVIFAALFLFPSAQIVCPRFLTKDINTFVPNAPFFYPLKTSENRTFRKNGTLYEE